MQRDLPFGCCRVGLVTAVAGQQPVQLQGGVVALAADEEDVVVGIDGAATDLQATEVDIAAVRRRSLAIPRCGALLVFSTACVRAAG